MTTPDSPATTLRHALAGTLILLGLLLQVFSFAGFVPIPNGVGYALWLGTLLLWRDIPRRTRWQASALVIIGLGSLLLANWRYAAEVDWLAVTGGNTYVVAMLVGVSFISLIGNRSGSKRSLGRPVTGRREGWVAFGKATEVVSTVS